MIRTIFLQFRRQGDITHGPSQLESVRVVFLVPDTPTKCPLQPDRVS